MSAGDREWAFQYGYFVNGEMVAPLGKPVALTLEKAEALACTLAALGLPEEVNGAYLAFDYAVKCQMC